MRNRKNEALKPTAFASPNFARTNIEAPSLTPRSPRDIGGKNVLINIINIAAETYLIKSNSLENADISKAN